MPGMTGILVTCNREREAQCVKEMYDMLGQHFDDDGIDIDTAGNEGQELEDALQAEVKRLTSKKNKKFLSISLGKDVGCLAFIKTLNDSDTVSVVTKIISNSTQKCIKSTQRLIPLQAISYANIKDFSKIADKVIKEHAVGRYAPSTTFAIVIESRMNSSMDKRVIVEMVGEMMGGSTGYKVDLKKPDLVVMVQVLKNVCGISIIPGYYSDALQRMNVQSVRDSYTK
jgi:tRNA acetyltransferase TAN1